MKIYTRAIVIHCIINVKAKDKREAQRIYEEACLIRTRGEQLEIEQYEVEEDSEWQIKK